MTPVHGADTLLLPPETDSVAERRWVGGGNLFRMAGSTGDGHTCMKVGSSCKSALCTVWWLGKKEYAVI